MSVSQDTATLHQAIEEANKSEILQLLQEKKSNFNETRYGNSVLHTILQKENFTENDVVELLEAFLVRGVDPNIQNSKEQTVLRLAVEKRQRDTADLLIRHNANILMCDKDGYSIAHYFVVDECNKNKDILGSDEARLLAPQSEQEKKEREGADFAEWMISKGFDFDHKNNRGISALHLSMNSNLHHISVVLLKHTHDINFIDNFGNTLLHTFIDRNYYCKNQYLEDEIRINWLSNYFSRYASKIVKILLEKGVDTLAVNKSFSRTSLQRAIECLDDQNIIEVIVDHRLKNCDKNAATALLMELMEICMYWGETKTGYLLKTLNSLVTKGADVNTKDINGISPLYYAFHYKNEAAVKFLNDHNADFRVINNNGETLLYALAKRDTRVRRAPNEEEVVESLFVLLMSKGCCDINARNVDNQMPLHLASQYENLVIIRKLIDNGADVNCKDRYEMTPLHLATQYGFNEKVIEMLLERGANINAKDLRGQRPLHLAVNKNEHVVQMLLKWAYSKSYATDDNRPPSPQAIKCSYLANTNKMLAYGADVNDERIITILKNPDPHLPMSISMKAVLHYWIKLKTLDLTDFIGYEVFIKPNEYQRLYQEYSTEIGKLKNTFIDSHTSIYTLLCMDVGSRCIHINNEKLEELVGSSSLEKQFPQYFVVILAKYREMVTWRKLLEPAKRAWRELTKIALPEECMERIFAYLRIEDLVVMVEYYDNK